MKATIFVITLLLFVAACSKEQPEPTKLEPEPTVEVPQVDESKLMEFYITVTDANGVQPGTLKLADGAKFKIKSFDRDIRFEHANTGLSVSIPQNQDTFFTFVPEQAGTYTLSCEGCQQGNTALVLNIVK